MAMTETEFWKIIDESVSASDGNQKRQKEFVHSTLTALGVDETFSFYRHYSDANRRAYRYDLWGAAYVINGGCSDDGFMDFRDWLVSRGKREYDLAMMNPDSLGDVLKREDRRQCGFEGFGYIAQRVWESFTGELMPVDSPHPKKPLGYDWNEDELPKLYPKLWALFGG